MKAPNETALVKTLLQWLHLHKICAWRVNSGAVVGEHKGKRRFVKFNGAAGCSDIIGLVSVDVVTANGGNYWQRFGRMLAIEAKVKPNKLTPDQAAFLEMVRGNGGIAICAYSVQDLEDALKDAGVRLP